MVDQRPHAVVVGMSETGLAALRLLGRSGVQCWAVGEPPDAPEFTSRYCRGHEGLASGTDDEALLAALLRIRRRSTAHTVLIPASDRDVLFASRRRSDLSGMFHMVLPPEEVVEDLLDKERFAALTERTGFPSPTTVRLRNVQQVAHAVAALGLPFIVKPQLRGSGFLAPVPKALVVRDEADCERLAGRLGQQDRCLWLAQTYVPGDDACQISVAVCIDHGGRPAATFTARKRRQGNMGNGVGTCVVSTRDDEATDLAVEFLRAIGYVGVAEVELKRDACSGRPYLIEVNARLWSQTMLAAVCGYNFPRMQYDLALGQTPRPAASDYGTVIWQDVWDDFYWSFRRGAYRARGRVSALGWLCETLRGRAHPYASWLDPAPWAHRVWRLAGRILGRRSKPRRTAPKAASRAE